MPENSPDFEARVREIVQDVLSDTLNLPKEFKGWIPKWLEVVEPSLHLESMVGNLNANRIAANSITADKLETVLALVSALLAGSADGARVEIGYGITLDGNGDAVVDPSFTGIRAYDGDGNLTFKIDAGGATAQFKGRVFFGTLGPEDGDGTSRLTTNDMVQLLEQPGGSFLTPQLEQSASGGSGRGTTSTGSATWDSPTTSGNELIMSVVAYDGGGAPTFTTPAGWTLVNGGTFDSGNSRRGFYRKSSSGDSGTQSITFSAAPDIWSVQMFEFSGVQDVEDGASALNAGSGTTASTGTSGTLTQSDIVVAMIDYRGNFINHPGLSNPTAGYTQIGDTDQSQFGFGAALQDLGQTVWYKTASSGTHSLSATTSGVNAWAGNIFTLKAKANAVAAAASNTFRLYGKDVSGISIPHVVNQNARESSLALGSAGEVFRWEVASVALNIPSTAAHSGGTGTFSFTGLVNGDYVFTIGRTDNATVARGFILTVNPLCSVDGQVTYSYFNADSATVDPGSQTVYFLVLHRS